MRIFHHSAERIKPFIFLHIMQKGIIMFLLLSACTLIVWFIPGDYNHDLAALVNKRDMLISAKTPRIIVIGGSNLITLDSARLERELNKTVNADYSTVNLGLWGGLSMERYLEEIKPYLVPGDTVVICQEYGTMLSPNYFNYLRQSEEAKEFLFLMKSRKNVVTDCRLIGNVDDIKHIILLNQLKIKTYLHILIDGNITHVFTGGFYRYADNYTVHGDRRKPFKIVRPLGEQGVRFEESNTNNLLYLKHFARYGHGRKIRVFFSFPPFPENEYRLNKNHINSLVRVIGHDLGINILTMPETTVYPEACFADTVNHLQPRCEKMRTAELIEQLRTRLTAP